MAAQEIIAMSVLLLLVGFVPPVLPALTYDVYTSVMGHTRNYTGIFDFVGLPPNFEAPANVTAFEVDTFFKLFSDFAKAIVASVQTQEFPYDLLRRIMAESYGEREVVAYQSNIIITCAVVSLFVLGLLIMLGVCIFKKRRHDQRQRFRLKKQLFDQKRGRIIIIISFILAIFHVIFLMCSLISSNETNNSMLTLSDDVVAGLDGVSTYFNMTAEQWNFMSNDTNIWALLTVMQGDVNDVGSLVWQPGVQAITPDLVSRFTRAARIDEELVEAVTYLTDMQTQINAILGGTSGTTLTDVMNEIYYNLSFAVADNSCAGCDGSCSGCYSINEDDIYYNMDFNLLTNVTTNLMALIEMQSNKIANTLIDPEYYFWKGIGDYYESQANVSGAMADLTISLNSYSQNILNSTNNIITPNDTDLYFDTFRGEWDTWYANAKGLDGARYAFHLIFAIVNMVVLGLLYIGWALLFKPGLIKLNPKDDNFKLPRRIILLALICCLILSCGYLILSLTAFYAGANTEEAICIPARGDLLLNETVDYVDGIPHHSGLFLASLLLGNGSIFNLYVRDALRECRNNATSYNVFHQDYIVPNIYQDLEYATPFENVTEYFNAMLISMPNVTLVPPLFLEWVSNFTAVAEFNFTEYTEFLSQDVIAANLTDYTNNLALIYNYTYPDGPMEPAKSRLYEVRESLLGEEAELTDMTTLKNNVQTAFNNYMNLVNAMISNMSSIKDELTLMEPDIQPSTGFYISEGVSLYEADFMSQLLSIQNQSQEWVTDVGPCLALANSYDLVVNAFCNKYSDNVNATWILLGHSAFFLLILCITTVLLFREIPQVDDDEMQDDLDIKQEFPKLFGHRAGCCCCCCCIPCGGRRRRKKKYQKDESRPTTHDERRSSQGSKTPVQFKNKAVVGVAPGNTSMH